MDVTPAIYGDYLSDLDALLGGIASGFAVVSFRGKDWRVKHQGEETLIRNKEGEPVRKLRVIIVGVSPALSKTFYAGAYEPGSTENPDCASADGIRPDIGVPDKQSDLCANCRNNQFGSRITENGKKSKACADHKRLAIVPADDIKNEAAGGPMLLRIPPASLQNLVTYVNLLKQHRVPPFAVITDISFDPIAEFPKLVLTPVGKIQDAGILDTIVAVKSNPVTDSILNGMSTGTDLLPSVPAPKQQQVTKASPQIGTQPARRRAAQTTAPEEAEEVDQRGRLGQGDDDGSDQTDENDETATSDADAAGVAAAGEDDNLDLTVGIGGGASTPSPKSNKAAPRKGTAAPKTLTPRAETALGDLLGGLG
jgi:hypothetical protein